MVLIEVFKKGSELERVVVDDAPGAALAVDV